MKLHTCLVLVPTLCVGTQVLEALLDKIYHKDTRPLVKHSQVRAWERAYGGFTSYELIHKILEGWEHQFPLSLGSAGCPSSLVRIQVIWKCLKCFSGNAFDENLDYSYYQ